MADERVPADYEDMEMLDAERFDRKVREHFMPAFPSMAKQIVNDYGVLEGTCVDVGSGTAHMAIELCRRTNLRICALEVVNSICRIARRNIESEGLTDRILLVLGDAHNLPFRNEAADFIISRGSYHCWKDKALVIREIYRVLKTGGLCLVGGGFGRYLTENELNRMISLRDFSLKGDAEYYRSPKKLEKSIHEAGILNFRIIYDRTGLWAEIKK
ncbi:MAG: class I SAM-dependent methyltransferase [Candidatus Freyrarchaeum guaymaensis]